uniref:Uncharacterized protein n=1 Tax=Mycena chlorophos TaxID=658473 RepID=A0ABQ0KW46_MYCCL|nr:predicted protein [Mycena chlorophos]
MASNTGLVGIIIFLLLIILGGAGVGTWWYLRRRKQRQSGDTESRGVYGDVFGMDYDEEESRKGTMKTEEKVFGLSVGRRSESRSRAATPKPSRRVSTFFDDSAPPEDVGLLYTPPAYSRSHLRVHSDETLPPLPSSFSSVASSSHLRSGSEPFIAFGRPFPISPPTSRPTTPGSAGRPFTPNRPGTPRSAALSPNRPGTPSRPGTPKLEISIPASPPTSAPLRMPKPVAQSMPSAFPVSTAFRKSVAPSSAASGNDGLTPMVTPGPEAYFAARQPGTSQHAKLKSAPGSMHVARQASLGDRRNSVLPLVGGKRLSRDAGMVKGPRAPALSKRGSGSSRSSTKMTGTATTRQDTLDDIPPFTIPSPPSSSLRRKPSVPFSAVEPPPSYLHYEPDDADRGLGTSVGTGFSSVLTQYFANLTSSSSPTEAVPPLPPLPAEYQRQNHSRHPGPQRFPSSVDDPEFADEDLDMEHLATPASGTGSATSQLSRLLSFYLGSNGRSRKASVPFSVVSHDEDGDHEGLIPGPTRSSTKSGGGRSRLVSTATVSSQGGRTPVSAVQAMRDAAGGFERRLRLTRINFNEKGIGPTSDAADISIQACLLTTTMNRGPIILTIDEAEYLLDQMVCMDINPSPLSAPGLSEIQPPPSADDDEMVKKLRQRLKDLLTELRSGAEGTTKTTA